MRPVRCRGCDLYLSSSQAVYCSHTCRQRAEAHRRRVAADRARRRRAVENHPASAKERQ